MRMAQQRLQVVVFGATSFVGQILCRYLAARHADGGLRWAIAGRSADKLEQLRAQLGPSAANLPMIVAEASDDSALRAMCARTDVVVSTVGPYAYYGSPLVKACVDAGTDYCDLTGEVQWIARMIAEHEEAAQRSGARIVHCCGFDSVPSDLGVLFLQGEAQRRYGQPCTRVKLRIKAMRGGVSGGTVASLMNVVEEARRDPEVRRLLASPYAICPPQTPQLDQPDVRFVQYDGELGSWLAPFVMAAINTRVVHRSNALAGSAYGVDFRYDEAMLTGPGLKGRAYATAVAVGLGGFVGLALLPPGRWLLQKYVVPKPGEGPSPEAQEKGFYDFRFHGTTADGQRIATRLTGDRDPGYGSTAKILGEAAACLAQDLAGEPRRGGFWTPASLLGDRLIPRLRAHAGLTFECL